MTTPEDNPITVCLIIQDVESASQIHTVTVCDAPDNGTISFGPVVNNSVIPHTVCLTYTPISNFNGTDSICLTICDNGSPFLCDNAVIRVTVTPVNDPPVANDDSYTTNEDTPLNISAPGVLANDSDPADGTSVTVTGVVSGPTNGTLTLNPNGSFTYIPNPNFNGTDVFCYRITDSGTPSPFLSDTACVTIRVIPVNDRPIIPDTTVNTPEDVPVTVCVPFTDADGNTNTHTATLLCSPQRGTITPLSVNQATDVVCFTYTPGLNYNGQDQLCIVLCDNGSPVLCDTSFVTINITPVNDAPFADTVFVTTFENKPVGVNVSAATGDPEGNPLTYTYFGVIPGGGTFAITGNGTINVYPNSGFTGTFTIPYRVCDLSPFPVNVLCDTAVIIVKVLPATDTLVNHAPVASNDYVTTSVNTPVVINQLANDYDPDGDPLQVTVTGAPTNGTFLLNPNGTINYFPNSGFFGYDTIRYTICDPAATKLPKPLCDNAFIVIFVSTDSTATVNDPPVAADEFKFICSSSSVQLNVLQNDYDPNGNALTSVSIIKNVSNGTLSPGSLGIYLYTPTLGFNGNDTLIYRVCDNGNPVLCDTALAVISVAGNPVITPSATSLNICSNENVNITFTSNIPGTTFTWSATNGTSGTGNINTVLTNNTNANITVTYSVTGISPNGCASTTINIPVIVRPRPTVTASVNGVSFCSGDNVLINLASNLPGTTYAWSGSNGTSGTGTPISDNPINSGISDITVTYTITPTASGCVGTPLSVSVLVRPKPVLTANPLTQTVCSGSPASISISSTVPGTSFSWSSSSGNSGNTAVINESPFNNTPTNQTITYTINGNFNGCAANTIFATIVVRPRVVADAGPDFTAVNCSASCVTLGGSPTGSGGTGNLTYAWGPGTSLSSTSSPNPTACALSNTTIYTVTVTDAAGCSATDAVQVTILPSTLVAEAGSGGQICLGSGNSVTLGGTPTAVGGNAPYTYTWSPVSDLNLTNPANPIATPGVTTKYFVTVTDQSGCTSIDSVTVIVHPAVFVNAGNDTTICAGNSVIIGGSPTASGGAFPYLYQWTPEVGLSNNNVANPVATPVATTNYTVLVRDANGCTARDVVIVRVNTRPIADAGPDRTLVSCPSDSVIIGGTPAATGGAGGYSYQWIPGTGLNNATVANPSVKGLTNSAFYTLLVTDANGCTSTDVVLVNVVPGNLVADAGNDKEYCAGSLAPVTLGGSPTAVGGSPAYNYSWSPVTGLIGSPNSPNPLANPSSTTTYYLTVTDSKGCVSTDSVIVRVNPLPVVNAGNDTAICSGTSVIIGGNPTATGGSGSYSYQWQPGTGLSSATVSNPVARPASTTSYIVTVTDSKGCSATDNITVFVRPNPVADAGPDKTLVACSSDSIVIGGSPSASGGQSPYIYTWTPATGLSSITAPNPSVKNLGSSTTYTLIVRDANGCTSSDQVFVQVNQPSLVVEAGPNAAYCKNTPAQIPLGGVPTVTGGVSPITYSWTPAAGLNITNISNPIASPDTTTTYTVVVTDARGCQASDTVRITVYDSPIVNAGRDTTVCFGTTLILGGNPTATGGRPPFRYQWSPTNVVPVNGANPIAYPTGTTTYVVTVTDANNCTATDNIVVNVAQPLIVSAGPNRTITSCPGDSVTIGGSPTASGGTGAYRYSWSPSTGLSSTNVANPIVSGITQSTVYTVTVTDALGCSATAIVTVQVVPSTLQANAGNDIFICFDPLAQPVTQLGGNPTAIGGTSPYTYSWSPAVGLNNPNIPNPIASPSATTTYFVLVTDNKGCTATDTVAVSISNQITVVLSNDTSICAGDTVRLGRSPVVIGGNPPYTYSWTPSFALSNSSAANPLAFPSTTTTYVLNVTDARGCTGSGAQTISVNPNPVADAGPDKILVNCAGATVTLGGTPPASGGSGGFQYQWTPLTGINNASLPNPTVSGISSSQNYTLRVTDSKGCKASDQVLVTVVPSSLTAEAGIFNTSICFGDTSGVVLGGFPTAQGGTPSYTYNWAPSIGLSSASVSNPVARPLTTTTYYVTVTDVNGCTAVDSVTIRVNSVPLANAGRDTSICLGSSVQLGGNPSVTGGTGPYAYNWSPLLGNVSNPTVTPTSTTVYGLTVVDANGCASNSIVTVTVRPRPTADAGPDKNLVSCNADSVILGGSPVASGGTPPYNYNWQPFGFTVAQPVVKNLASTTDFTLVVTDQFGCTASDVVRVNVSASTLQVNAGNGGAYCEGTNGSVQLGGSPTAQGGTPPYTYVWTGPSLSSNNTPNPIASPAQTTTYTVVVTDAAGCQAAGTVTVTVRPKPVVNFNLNNPYCSNTPSIPLTGTPGGGTFSGTGVSGNLFVPSLTGSGTFNITYSYTDNNGCSNSITKPIIITPAPVVTLSNNNTEYCKNDPPITLVGNPAGGRFFGNGVDSITGIFSPSLAQIGNNVISYIYTDANGCTAGAFSNIRVKSLPSLNITASKDTICIGGSAILSASYSPDVLNIQWFDVNGTFITTSLNPVTVNPVRKDHGYVAVAINVPNNCIVRDTVFIHVNQRPVANPDVLNTCEDSSITVSLTTNDTDEENDRSFITILKQPKRGSVAILNSSTGTIRYTPDTDFNGSEVFEYILCNQQCVNDCDTASVLVNVCPVNDPPVITVVVTTIPEDSSVVVCPPVFDADTNHLVVSVVNCGAANGTVTKTNDTCFLYKPNTDWNGIDTICTVVCDPFGACDSSIVIINVTPRNEPPVANPITVTTIKNVPVPVNVASATLDPNGDPMNYSYGTPSVPGTVVTVTTNGGIVIAPPSGYTGVITIPYYVCDLAKYPFTPLCDTSFITVVVSDTGVANQPPVANNDYASTPKGVPVSVNVFANDFDPNGDPIVVVSVINAPDNGIITSISGTTGVVGYLPNPNFEGCDTFTYVITDGKGGLDTADVVVCIINNPLYTNNPPVAVNDYASTNRNVPVTIPVLNNDNDPDGNSIVLQPSLPCGPLRGTVTVNSNGTITYTPGINANALQPDTFCYVICDNGNPQLCDTARVVVSVPNSVVAVNDDTITGLNTPVTVNVFANDFDPENDSFCLAGIVAQPVFGSLFFTYINGDSCKPLITYTPDSNFVGSDGFCYAIVDQWGARDTACVNINTIICISPQVIGDSIFMLQGSDTIIDVLANDIRYGVPLTVTIEQNSLHGANVQVIGNKVYYKPQPGFFGNDYLIYRASGICGTDTAYISITVIPACAAVNANNDYALTLVNTPVSVSVLLNDDNPNPNPLNASIIRGPKNGKASMTNGVLTYRPDSGFIGLDTIRYIACTRCAGKSYCDSALVIIQVDSTLCPSPVRANPDLFAVGYSCESTLDVVLNDINFIGTTISIIDSPKLGSVRVNNAGQIIYKPNGQNVSGKDDYFIYRLCNSCGQCDTAKVNIKITGFPCNGTYPIAIPDTFKICKNTIATLAPLANDYDPDGGILSLDSFIYTGNGVAVRANNFFIRYIPPADYIGTDFIYYTICDNGTPKLCQSAGIVIIVDSCVNHPPVVAEDPILDTTYVNTPNETCVNVFDPDGDAVLVAGSYGANHGSVAFSSNNNCFTYSPSRDFIGNDTFYVIVCDNNPYGSQCDTITVIYTVLPLPPGQTPPVAVTDVAATDSAKPVTVNILFNDYDNDGDSIYICVAPLSDPKHGTAVYNNNGTITYTPFPGFVGIDTFTYVLCDGGTPTLRDTGIVIVYVGVKPTPDARDLPCDSVISINNQRIVIDVLANDNLPLALDTIVSIVARPLNGAVAVNGDRTITYQHNEGFEGVDNFTYSVCVVIGNAVGCDTASVCVTVIDTTVECVFPNAFSPNGDGINDLFIINCNGQYPLATLRIFNRWGNEVWYSEGHYQNNWNGTNKENKDVPDGTYYYIYDYGDGTNRKEARFVVITR
ncbi:MAG: Ig-like domain-containing protein [Chitinophagales bacterium]|nr:Ig-like domain-containing protein [Chitinophagales bacterium]